MNLHREVLHMLEACQCGKELIISEETDTALTNPCMDGYEMIGMKEEDGRQVPNCVPIKDKDEQQKEHP